MKRTQLFLAFTAALVCTSSLLPAQNVKRGKVLLIAREGTFSDLELMLNSEVGVMTSLLQQAGFEVTVASPSGQPIVAATKTLKPDLKLSDVKIADYVGFVIPCLGVTKELPADFVPAVKDAIARGKPVAAQSGGVGALAKAGVLSGRKYALANVPDIATSPQFKDAVYSGTAIVQDGKIITSGICPMMAKATGLPNGTSRLTQALIDELLKK